MDTYSFHFERMSNVDLHPLSLPISRLSPAKSNSSIVDQLSHHQHGKGDSAYSSFSGGSTAPDYPSPFIPDDLQSSSFSHYGDLKYVKSVYHPSHVLQSDSKTMDQLRRSVEAISHQYHTNTSITVNNYNHNDSNNFHTNNKAVSKQEVILGAPSQSAYPHGCPPPVPARLDSFIATKNLENSRVHHHSPQFQPHHPQLQKQPRHYPQLSPPPHDLNSPVTDTVNPDTGDSRSSSDVYSVWRCSQQHQPQPQQPSSWRPPLQLHDQTKVPLTAEYLFIVDNKTVSEQQKSTNILSRSPPQDTSQHEDLKPKHPCGGFTEDNHNKTSGSSSHFESQSKRSHSSHDWLGSDPSQDTSKWNAVQGFVNGSIQHKGQFYFVTGVCKPTESGWRTHSGSMSETGSESTTVLEKYQLREREKERAHSTMENLFRPLQQSCCTFTGTVPDRRESFTSVSKGKDQSSRTQDQENHRPTLISKQSSRSFDALEEIDMMQSFEIGRHTASNPIFYCGPDRNYPLHSTMQAKEVTMLLSTEQPNNCPRGKQQPLGDVASERINKETTPLLYHLTGANRAVLKSKKDSDFSIQEKEAVLNKTSSGDMAVKDNERPPYSDTSRNERADVISAACNTLDDSFKKYYKEKLKDAQSKVLRETSFKRKDLQLSSLHCTRQKHEPSRIAIHSFSSSQDSETSTDTLTPSVTPEETDRGSIKEEVRENPKKTDIETEKENGRPSNVAQPQVSRIGGRKRLTPEQKNMCYSEPDKLNQLGGTPNHSSCRSFDDGSDNLCAVECEGEESEQQGEQGLVASRRRMFERRGRALSTSSASKTNLKHLQHKALVEYMERKTGQKVAEPQQPAPQLPPPPRQRHSLGEKPFDWIPRPLSGNHENKNMKKKFHRPHSAGRILDSTSGSVRYAQFFSAQSCSGQYAGQPNQSRWRESHGSSQGKSLSVENLLDQSEPPSFLRSRSTSTPHAFQTHDYDNDPLPVKSLETCSSPKVCTEDSLAKPAPEGQQLVRMLAQRGKSMEELGASKSTRPSALSKSSEQLDQFWRNSTKAGGPDRDISFISEVRQAQGQERGRKKHHLTEENRQEPLTGGQKGTQGQMQHQTQKKHPVKQNSGEDVTAGTRNSSRSTSPASCSSSLARFHPGSHGPATATDKTRSSISPSETSSDPSSPRSLETLSSPTHTKLSCENRPCFSRFETCPSVTASEREQSVDEPSNDTLPHEVSLSCGVTTDPSLWILPPEEIKEEVQTSLLTDGGCDDEPTISAPQMQTSKTSVSPCTSVSDADISQQVEEEKNPEMDDEKRGENQGIKERGAPEGETESMERPSEKPHWEELVEAVVKADQSLVTVLYPLANRKTALMLMEQLLSEDTLLMEEHYKKKQEQRGASESVEKGKGDESSACPSPDSLKPQCTDLQGKTVITEKKHLLVSYIKEHLHSLEERRGALQTEIQENVAHGQALEMLVRDRCLPVELERYNLFIGDLEKVVSLLLCLSARLARVQNALSTVDQNTDVEEKQSLDSRHRLLCKQREDAKDLKDNLDRRENLVSTFLSRQLTAEQLQDYRRFVQTKASLLIQQKDLEEKLKLGEEQLEALSNSPNL